MNRFFTDDSDLYVKTLEVSGKLSLLSRKGRVTRFMEEEAVSLLFAVVDLGASSDIGERSAHKERIVVLCSRSRAILDLLSMTGDIGRVLHASLANDIDTVIKGVKLAR